MPVTYRQSGVDIDAADSLIERIEPLARRTRTRHVVDGLGGFAGLCSVPRDVEDPLLVSGTDGVGTKLKVAFATGRHGTVGQDLVAMCVNDVATTGAVPLFFLDYYGCGKLDVDVAESVITGISNGCRLAGCALLGGETAELPGMYPDGEYDLAGFCVGIVSRKKLLGPERVASGDRLVAVASSGLHSNGYSLARRVIEQEMGLALEQHVDDLGGTLANALLVPTRIYSKPVAALGEAIGDGLHALCHVTGGGIADNLPRALPAGSNAFVELTHERPPIFDLIARGGPVEETEMRRTFNLGVGLIAVVASSAAERAVETLVEHGEKAWVFGQVAQGRPGSPPGVEFR